MDITTETKKTGLRFDRFDLKMIAVTAMTVDHLAAFFLSYDEAPLLFIIMRVIGRLTAPIMSFFLAEGFIHTSSRLKYGIRLGVFALISQVPYSLVHHNRYFDFEDWSMITTLFLAFLALCVWEYVKPVYFRLPLIIGILYLCTYCDWYFFAPVWVLLFYIFRDNRKKQLIAYAVSSLIMISGYVAYFAIRSYLEQQTVSWLNLIQFSVLLPIPLLMLYNGQRGPGGKIINYFYYIYYPLHLLIIYLVLTYII